MQADGNGAQRNAYGIDDLSYDLVTLFHEKSKGLEAYARYIEDAGSNGEIKALITRMRDQDLDQVQELRDHVATVLGQGTQNAGDGQSEARSS